MPEATNNRFERLNDALRNLDDQIQELRQRFDDQRKGLEDRLRAGRDRVTAELRKSALYKRAETVRKDIEEQLAQGGTRFCDAFGIASKSELQKLSRKLNTLSKKLNELAREEQLAGERESESAAEHEVAAHV